MRNLAGIPGCHGTPYKIPGVSKPRRYHLRRMDDTVLFGVIESIYRSFVPEGFFWQGKHTGRAGTQGKEAKHS